MATSGNRFDLSISWDDLSYAEVSEIMNAISNLYNAPNNTFITKREEGIIGETVSDWLKNIRGTMKPEDAEE